MYRIRKKNLLKEPLRLFSYMELLIQGSNKLVFISWKEKQQRNKKVIN